MDGVSDLIFGMVVDNAHIKLPRKFQVDPTTQTHFLSDLFFLIAIRPAMVLKHHTKNNLGLGLSDRPETFWEA